MSRIKLRKKDDKSKDVNYAAGYARGTADMRKELEAEITELSEKMGITSEYANRMRRERDHLSERYEDLKKMHQPKEWS